MIWSKKHKLFREMLAPSLRPLLALKTTGYHAAYEQRGKTWITYDGQEVISFCDFRHENRWRELGQNLEAVIQERIFSKNDFGCALGMYLDMKVENALLSENPLIFALTMLDRRIGKRRLRILADRVIDEPAKTFLRLRLSAEGMVTF